MTTQAVAVLQPGELSGADYDLRLAEAQHKASRLAELVKMAHLAVKIGGREHLTVEAWTTIGEGYGYTAMIEWVRPLPDGGYEARAIVKDAFGEIRSTAEAECGSEGDEAWIGRSHFHQKSMAQTRAISKALRLRLSWVVVLAGFEPTPAEEMESAYPSAKLADDVRPRCPEHNVPLIQTKYGWTHKMQNGKWCNAYRESLQAPKVATAFEDEQPEELTPAQQILALQTELGWTDEQLKEHLVAGGYAQAGVQVNPAAYEAIVDNLRDTLAKSRSRQDGRTGG